MPTRVIDGRPNTTGCWGQRPANVIVARAARDDPLLLAMAAVTLPRLITITLEADKPMGGRIAVGARAAATDRRRRCGRDARSGPPHS